VLGVTASAVSLEHSALSSVRLFPIPETTWAFYWFQRGLF